MTLPAVPGVAVRAPVRCVRPDGCAEEADQSK